ncbi:nuclear envelope-associated protein 1-like isoform X2 [Apium graveolens]|uniref:nuclear envelope-associated protein 1-like isoform X2 n=1 Tax=Apium graveolens TaxID=4045 RepID=UPI003D7B78EF
MVAMSNSREINPLLKDLSERKQSFRQNVVLLATELKEEAEMIVNDMKEEVYRLHMCLDERNGKFQEAASTAENEGVAFEFRTMDGFVLVAGEDIHDGVLSLNLLSIMFQGQPLRKN